MGKHHKRDAWRHPTTRPRFCMTMTASEWLELQEISEMESQTMGRLMREAFRGWMRDTYPHWGEWGTKYPTLPYGKTS